MSCPLVLNGARVGRNNEPRVLIVHNDVLVVFLVERYVLKTVILLLKKYLFVFHNSYPFLMSVILHGGFYIVSPLTYNIAINLGNVNSFGENS